MRVATGPSLVLFRGLLRLLARELGPREVAILLVALGVYLAIGALWPEGATGAALITAGGLAFRVTTARKGRSSSSEDSLP